MGAGRLDRRFAFSKRQEVDDGAGNTVGSWVLQFTAAGERTFLKGGESVMASRLEAKGPVILCIRNSTQARMVGNDWRAVDTRTGAIFNIRENPRESEDRSMLEMLAESGVAV